ncbi:hypothetical protein M407DRAFT_10603 [Tulasnella calospora MUT 4182]|uniref:Uncharacterized protein n=1 Tax=Tulasnella calospora MUT 4182 TaxID=1051891 RepID=A0A0C3Q938_9AGAM|nr:hypothetical protein M407DRAFT_10603 [Tulasnella calospora MUT 4182]
MDHRVCINDLPGELLGTILTLSIGDQRPRRDISCLELTCRQWQELVEGTPSCWTNITAVEVMDFVRQALFKSRDASIDLLYDSWNSDGDFSEFIAAVDPHIQRWRSLAIFVEVSPPDLGRLETTIAPRLEKLHLCQTSKLPWFGNPIVLFGGEGLPSKVSDVTFEGFSVMIHPPNLPNLVSLTLKDVESVQLCNIMEILRTSPHLEYVELDNIPNPSLLETCNPESSTQLDAVKAIALSGLGPSATSFLLSAIRVPKCCSLRINCDLGSGSPVQMLLTPDLTHLHCAIQNMARLANSIEIDRYHSRRHVFTVGDFKLILETEEEDKLREAFH